MMHNEPFSLSVFDSGGRYPMALELAPDLPRHLLRYDSKRDPFRDMYNQDRKRPLPADAPRTPSVPSPADTLSSDDVYHDAAPTMSDDYFAPGQRFSSHSVPPHGVAPHGIPPQSAPTPTRPSPYTTATELSGTPREHSFSPPNTFGPSTTAQRQNLGLKGKLAQFLFGADSQQHGRSRSVDATNIPDPQAFLPVRPPVLAPVPPPLPPKPSSYELPLTLARGPEPVLPPRVDDKLANEEKYFLAVEEAPERVVLTVAPIRPGFPSQTQYQPPFHPDSRPTPPPVVPPPPLVRSYDIDSTPERDVNEIITRGPNGDRDPLIVTPKDTTVPVLVQPQPPAEMSRLQQWAQTLQGQRFEEEEGMLGPYETNSVVGMAPTLPTLSSPTDSKKRKEKKDVKKRDDQPLSLSPDTLKTSPRLLPTIEESPPSKDRSRSGIESPKTDKYSRSGPDTPKTDKHSQSGLETPKTDKISRSGVDTPRNRSDSIDNGKKHRSKKTDSKTSTPRSKAETKSRSHSRSISDGGDNIALNEARSLTATPTRSARHQSLPPSEHYFERQMAHDAALARLERHAGVPHGHADPHPYPNDMKNMRHLTQDTQSTASFGHLLHSNGRPVPVNMQTQAGLLPRSLPRVPVGATAPGSFHRKHNSNGTPLGDISEQTEPLPSNQSQHSASRTPIGDAPFPVPMTGEAAKYYARAETVSDVDSPLPANGQPTTSSVPTRQDSGELPSVAQLPPATTVPDSYVSMADPHPLPAEVLQGLNIFTPQNNGSLPPDPHTLAPSALSYRHSHQSPPGQSFVMTVGQSVGTTASPLNKTFTPSAFEHEPLMPTPTYVPTSEMPGVSHGAGAHSSVHAPPPLTMASAAPVLPHPAKPRGTSPSSVPRGISVSSEVSVPRSPTSRSVATALVPQMIQHSSFHDETLCQLLDASRLNLLGDEAKKALMRAARARVVELKDIREKTKQMEKGVNARTEPLIIKKREKEAKKHHKSDRKGKRAVPSSPDSSDGETVKGADAKSNVEELLESLLEKQEVDRATREHVCKDPANHSRCLSPNGDLEKVEEELYRTRAGVMYTPYGYPGPYMQQPAPQPPYVTYVMPPPHVVQFPPQAVPEHGHSPDSAYRAGVQSRDSQDVLAEVLNVNYAGVSVKQILEDFIRERHEMNAKQASIHSIPATPVDTSAPHPPMPVQSRFETAVQTTPAQTARSLGAGTSVRSQSPPHPPQVATPVASSRGTGPASPVQASPKVPSPRTASSLPPSVPSTEKDSATTQRSNTVDWSWEPEIKIRVQPPTTLTNTTAVPTPQLDSENPSVKGDRAAPSPQPSHPPPPPSSVISARTNIDYTASYLPHGFDLDRDLPPLPPSTYVPSVPGTAPSDGPSSLGYPPTMTPPFKGTPWELVTHRLYSWALVWEDDYFSKALESISIGRPVDEFPLTVLSMMMFKRILQIRMTSTPPQPCDKLFVPPNIAEAINKAVHAKEYDTAQALLEALWYMFGFKEPPRVIISLVRHGAIKSAWIANRYDLVTHRFATYIVCNNMPTQEQWDGRPFMWWHAIRKAWPKYNIPDPIALTQVIKPISVPAEFTEDISLRAASISRNLLLGIRPEHDHDIPKLRKQTWTEVNRLHTKKRAGRLLVHKNEL